jgi:putative transposase
MRQVGLTCKRKSRYVHTTDSKHGEPVYPNVIKDVPIVARESMLGGGSNLCTLARGLCVSCLHRGMPTPASALAGVWLARWTAVCRFKRLSMALAERQVPAGLIHHVFSGSAVLQLCLRGTTGDVWESVSVCPHLGKPLKTRGRKASRKTVRCEEVYVHKYQTFEEAAAALTGFSRGRVQCEASSLILRLCAFG